MIAPDTTCGTTIEHKNKNNITLFVSESTLYANLLRQVSWPSHSSQTEVFSHTRKGQQHRTDSLKGHDRNVSVGVYCLLSVFETLIQRKC